MKHHARDVVALLGWVGALAIAIVVFTALGHGRLAGPPLTDPGGFGDWAAGRDGVVATVALLRVLVLALAWYLLAVTLLGALARLTRRAHLVRVADAVTVPVARRLLQAALGATLVTAVAVSAGPLPGRPGLAPVGAAGVDATEPDARGLLDAPRMRPLGPADGETSPSPAPPDRGATPGSETAPDHPDASDDAPPGMRALPTPTTDTPTTDPSASDPPPTDTPSPDGSTRDTPPGAPSPGQRAQDPAAVAPDPGDEVVEDEVIEVVPGDHLWAIAEQHLARAPGAPSGEHDVAAYWHRLIAANRDRLVDPGNPDLILPGQRLVLPAVETPTSGRGSDRPHSPDATDPS